MTETTVAAERGRAPRASVRLARTPFSATGDFLLRSILPLVLALGAGRVILAAIGVDPIQYYKDIYSGGSSSRRGRTRPCACRSCSSPSG